MSNLHFVIELYSVAAVLTAILSWGNWKSPLTILLFVLFAFCYILYAYNGSILKKILLTAATALVYFLIFIFSCCTIAAFRGEGFQLLTGDNHILAAGFLLASILTDLVSRCFLFYYRNKHSLFPMRLHNHLFLLMLPVLCIFTVMTLFFALELRSAQSVLNITGYSSIIFISLIFSCLMYQSDQQQAVQSKNRLLEDQLNSQIANAKTMADLYYKSSGFSHDYRAQLATLSVLLHQKQYDKATDYLDQITDAFEKSHYAVQSGHIIVDAVLNRLFYQAKEQGITMELQVGSLKQLAVSEADLVVLFTNTLANAMEAVAALPSDQRIIHLRAYLEHDDFVYLVRNRTAHDIKIAGNKIPTTKKNPAAHGFGLHNVQRILEKYKAVCLLQSKDKWFQFSTVREHATNPQTAPASSPGQAYPATTVLETPTASTASKDTPPEQIITGRFCAELSRRLRIGDWVSFSAILPDGTTAQPIDSADPDHSYLRTQELYWNGFTITVSSIMRQNGPLVDSDLESGPDKVPFDELAANRPLWRTRSSNALIEYQFLYDDLLVIIEFKNPHRPDTNDPQKELAQTDAFATALADTFQITKRIPLAQPSTVENLEQIKAAAQKAIWQDVQQRQINNIPYDGGWTGPAYFYPKEDDIPYFAAWQSKDKSTFFVSFHIVTGGLWSGNAMVDATSLKTYEVSTNYTTFFGISPEMALVGELAGSTREINGKTFVLVAIA